MDFRLFYRQLLPFLLNAAMYLAHPLFRPKCRLGGPLLEHSGLHSEISPSPGRGPPSPPSEVDPFDPLKGCNSMLEPGRSLCSAHPVGLHRVFCLPFSLDPLRRTKGKNTLPQWSISNICGDDAFVQRRHLHMWLRRDLILMPEIHDW